MILIYETNKFQSNLPQNLKEDIERFKEQISKLDVNEVKSILDRHGPYLKKRILNYRIISKLEFISEFPVLILLDILSRGGINYTQFNNDAISYGINFLEPIIKNEYQSIQIFVDNNKPQVPPKPLLPDYFYQWMGTGTDTTREETLIYETYEWVEKTKSPSFLSYKTRFYDVLLNLIQSTDEIVIEPINNCIKTSYNRGKKEYKVVYNELLSVNNQKIFILIQPLIEPEILDQNTLNDFTNLFNKNFIPDNDTLAKISYRAYPDYILAEEKLWYDIETDSQANLALSSEEENILQELKSNEKSSFPIFINGRAGSGKSTILYYIYSDFINKKLRKGFEGSPIFITYNEMLLETAKKTVKSILNSNAEFANENQTIELNDLNPYFKTFYELLFTLLPDEQKIKFEPDKRITFHKFKTDIWEKIYNKPNYLSPELSWFIIRAYIKGYYQNKYMEPIDYSELPRREKIITNQIFDDVYNYVWKSYETISVQNKYWDDQDLVRELLNSKLEEPEYIALFCDEAQDFTRIELRFLMRLLIFSKYQIPIGIKSIPIVFAGDPLQTINPTGFRWEATGSIFHEEIIQEIDPNGRLGIKLNFKELTYNYRSTPSITKFSNVILMWRDAITRARLSPQLPWRTNQEGTIPYRFEIQSEIKDKLKEILKDKIVIVPVEEEQLKSFVKSDELLKEIFVDVDNNWPVKNILTPILAKGLEFDDVIIYKFGDHFHSILEQKNYPTNLHDLFSQVGDDIETSFFEINYFFNQLYVSTSRAKKNLYLIDTNNGNKVLWRYTLDENSIFTSIPQDYEYNKWSGYVSTTQIGDIQTLLLTPEEKRKNANELKQRGLIAKEPNLLKMAAQYFNELSNISESTECLAYSYKFEEKYEKAAELFQKIHKYDEVKECLITGKQWDLLLNFYHQHSSQQNEPTFKVVNYITSNENDINSFIDFTQFLNKIILDRNYLNFIKNKFEWITAFDKYFKFIRNYNQTSNITDDIWQTVINILREIETYFGRNATRCLALANFYSGNYELACQIWDRLRENDHENYYVAKSKILNPPANLKYLLKLGLYDEIINLWESSYQTADLNWFEDVKEAIIKKSLSDKLIILYVSYDKFDNALKLFEQFINKATSEDDIFELTDKIINRLIVSRFSNYNKLEKNEIEKLKYALYFLNYLIQNIQYNWDKKALIFSKNFSFIAYSDTVYSDYKEISELFEQVFQFLQFKTLLKYLNIEEIASILERTVTFKTTLEFYYNFIENVLSLPKKLHDILKDVEQSVLRHKIVNAASNSDFLFIVKRMIKVRLKQAYYHKEKGEIEIFESIYNEAKEFSKLFSIELSEIEISEPYLPQPFPIKFNNFEFEPTLKSVSEFEKSFAYYPFEFRINRKTKLILMTNLETYDTKKISLDSNQFPDQFAYGAYELLIEKDSSNLLVLKFYSSISGEKKLDGIVTINL
ncbi:MAG: hypothetical protein QXR30_04980 [Candidatus Woesearchaeota archaeon]